MIPLLIAGAAATAAGEVANALSDPEPNPLTRAVSAVRGIDPVHRNTGVLPTEDQVKAWMRKVGRPDSLRSSINIVPRNRTSPYVGSDGIAMDMREFARLAGEGTGTGIRGGYVLAVLCSVETSAGNPYGGTGGVPKGRNASLYNNNPGNTKYYTAGARADNPTPPVYFLVDNIASLDMYESHADLQAGFASWKTRTFGNSRYTQYGTMDALRAGDLNAFCEAIGRAGYAASYRLNRKYMEPRAHVLTRTGSYRNLAGRASLDDGILVYR